MVASLLEKLEALTLRQKYIAFSSIVGLLLAAFIWFIYIPIGTEIGRQEEEIAVLNTEINVRQTKARRLEELKKEYKVLRVQLIELEKRLPPEAEVEILLKQVSELGERNGLLVKLWKPGQKTLSSSGIYTEIPMAVEVSGGYHSLGSFFEKVSELDRIVTISNIRIGNANTTSGRFFVETSFLATTFAVIEKTEIQSGPSG